MTQGLEELSVEDSLSPKVIIIGESIDHIKHCYVSVKDVFYKFDSVMQSVDMCFKIMHGLYMEYPKKSKQIWNFFQKYIYKISTLRDQDFISVHGLIADLENFK